MATKIPKSEFHFYFSSVDWNCISVADKLFIFIVVHLSISFVFTVFFFFFSHRIRNHLTKSQYIFLISISKQTFRLFGGLSFYTFLVFRFFFAYFDFITTTLLIISESIDFHSNKILFKNRKNFPIFTGKFYIWIAEHRIPMKLCEKKRNH